MPTLMPRDKGTRVTGKDDKAHHGSARRRTPQAGEEG